MTDLRRAINDLESPIIDLDTAYSAFAYFAEAADDDHQMAMTLHFVANTMGQIRDDLRAPGPGGHSTSTHSAITIGGETNRPPDRLRRVPKVLA